LENLQFKCIKLIKPALIELLLVVAIIGILVSFAIPAYQGSILKSRRSVAVSGLMDLVN
jgi:type IV pilus assembly protein PilE